MKHVEMAFSFYLISEETKGYFAISRQISATSASKECIEKARINGLFLVPNIYTFSNVSRNSSLYFLQFLWIIKLYLIYAPQVGKGDLVCISN